MVVDIFYDFWEGEERKEDEKRRRVELSWQDWLDWEFV